MFRFNYIGYNPESCFLFVLEDSLSMSLGTDLCIPSHEEVDQPSRPSVDLDADLIPADNIDE